MFSLQIALFLCSVVVCALLMVSGTTRPRLRVAAIVLVALACFAAFVLSRMATFTQARGEASPGPLVALYGAMLLGMLAQYLHAFLDRPRRRRRKFDLRLFAAPIFASPIVFIPLLATFEAQAGTSDLSRVPQVMLLLVAFENGFFWRGYLDTRRQLLEHPDKS